MMQVTDSKLTDLLAEETNPIQLVINPESGTALVSGVTEVVDIVKPDEADTVLQTFSKGFNKYRTSPGTAKTNLVFTMKV